MAMLAKHSVFFRVIILNAGISFLLFLFFLINMLFFGSALRREQQDSAARVLSTVAERFKSETVRLSALMNLCAVDPTFVLAVSNRIPVSERVPIVQGASQKLLLMFDSMPYARNVFVYIRNSKSFIFPNLVISRQLLFNTQGQERLPAEFADVDFESLSDGYHSVGDNHFFVSTFRDYGSFITLLDTGKFFGLTQLGTLMPNLGIAILDGASQIFAVGDEPTRQLFQSSRLKSIASGTFRMDGQTYRVNSLSIDGMFRAVSTMKPSPTERLEYNSRLIAALFSFLLLVVVCLVLVLLNMRIYLPLRRIVTRYREKGSKADEITLIGERISALSAENVQMHLQMDQQLNIQSEIELSLAVHATSPVSPSLASSLREQWSSYRVLVVATQDDTGGGDQALVGIDELIAERHSCRIIQVDSFAHAYLLLGNQDPQNIVETLAEVAPPRGSLRLLFAGLSDSGTDFEHIGATYVQARARLMENKIPRQWTFSFSMENAGQDEAPATSISLDLLNSIARSALSVSQHELPEIVRGALLGKDTITLKDSINLYRQISNLLLMLATPWNSVLEPARFKSISIGVPYHPTYMCSVLLEDFKNLAESRSRGGVAFRYNVVDYLNRRFREPLSLDTIAAEFQISPVYLSSWFKKKTGMNLSVYLATLRIEEAKRVLSGDRRIKIADVGRQVGLPDAGTFIRLFKKHAGCTPDRYRFGEARHRGA